MLGKCPNPACGALFRKLGNGKLFVFESVTGGRSASIASGTSGTETGRGPVFFWLCETCSSTFTLGLDAEDQLTLQRVPDGARVTIYDDRSLDHGG
jgi:hypothetical protein